MTKKDKQAIQEFLSLSWSSQQLVRSYARKWQKLNFRLGGIDQTSKIEMERLEKNAIKEGISNPCRLFHLI